MKLHDKKTRNIFHTIHLKQNKTKNSLNRIKNLLSCKNLKLNKDYFKGKICGDFGCGSTGAGALNLLNLGAKEVHLIDLKKHILKPIDKNLNKYKNRYKIHVGSIEKTKFPKNYFDFVLCQGVIHHMDNDNKGFKEIYRTLKPGGKSHIMVHGKNGLITRTMMEIIRPEYKTNPHVREFFNLIFSKKIFKFNKFFKKEYDHTTYKKYISFLKLIDDDFIITLKDRILAPKYKMYDEKELVLKLKKIGFKDIYRVRKPVRINNIRRFLAPFYSKFDHEIARVLYGEGNISLMITKK